MALTEAELAPLIAGGETQTLELKIKPPRPAELAERICGLANTRSGGRIVFGVDQARQIVGLAAPHEDIDLILWATRLIKPPLALPPPNPVLAEVAGHPLVVLEIPPNNGTLYQAGGIFWIRKGTHTIPMTGDEVEAHLNTYGSLRWERALCPRATLADLDIALLERYLSYRAERSRRQLRYTSSEELLVGLEAAAADPATGALRPTNAGMLLFGHDPQLHLPQSEVVCIRYVDSLGVGRYLDRKNFNGNLPELIDQTAEFLTRHMNMGAQIQGFTRVDRPEYPIEALREAVVNALVHRDYSRVGETVRVFFYADRIEVRSPGLLLPGITVADLQEMRVPSRPRNPLLAGFLRDIPGYMERVGSGIRLMIQEMRRLDLPDPEFVEQHEFVVILRGPGVPGTAVLGALNPRQLQGLQVVQEKGSINSQEYCAATGASDRTGLRDLRDLVDRGILVSRGAKRYTRYYLP